MLLKLTNIKNDLKLSGCVTGDQFGKRISTDFKHLFSLWIPFYSEVYLEISGFGENILQKDFKLQKWNIWMLVLHQQIHISSSDLFGSRTFLHTQKHLIKTSEDHKQAPQPATRRKTSRPICQRTRTRQAQTRARRDKAPEKGELHKQTSTQSKRHLNGPDGCLKQSLQRRCDHQYSIAQK